MSVFQSRWSCTSPVRQRDEEILTPIPHEIYYKIFDYFEPGYRESPSANFTLKESKKIFSNIAPVCKFFFSVALPRLFSSLDINGDEDRDFNSPNYSHLYRDVVQGRDPAGTLALHIALHVNSTSFKQKILRRCQFAFLGTYLEAISRMHSIETVNLYRTTVDNSALRALHALPRLKCLSIIGCRIAALHFPTTATVIRKLSSDLKLSSLEFVAYGYIKGQKVLANAFNLKNMKALCTNGRELLYRLSIQEEALALEKLELHDLKEDDIGLLNTVLPKLPCLTHLYVHDVQVREFSDLSFFLSPGAIPNALTSVVCPAFMFPAFISHPPLESLSLSEVEVEDGQFPVELTGQYEQEMLPHRSEFIRRLEVPPSFCLAVPFGELFPKLEELHVLVDHRNYDSIFVIDDASDFRKMMSQFCEAWSQPHTVIRHLRFSFRDDYSRGIRRLPVYYWDVHREIFTLISKVFPNLEQFAFVKIGEEDNDHWFRDHDGNSSIWHRFIPAEYLNCSVKEIFLTHFPHHYIDRAGYDGCFRSIMWYNRSPW